MTSIQLPEEVGLGDLFSRAVTLSSLMLERSLSYYHSTVQSTIDTVMINVGAASPPPHMSTAHHTGEKRQDGTTSKSSSSSRAWWDPKKGSAIVLWSAHDQDLTQQLALALASVPRRTRYGAAGHASDRSGHPPYTVIVLLPESSDRLATLIGAWARRKAEVTSTPKGGSKGKVKRSIGSSANPLSAKPAVEQQSGLLAFVWFWLYWSLGNSDQTVEQGNLDDPEEEARQGRTRTRSDTSTATTPSSPRSSTTRRRLSFGGWTAQDVVGYGRDMLKGLRIGQMEADPTIGAVIPVLADTSTAAGLQHAQSTIQAYCDSHDLLLRALVVVPSVMEQVQTPSEGHSRPRDSQRNVRPSDRSSLLQSPMHRLAHDTQTALTGDVGETLQLLATLLPTIRHDGGRVIGLVPTRYRFARPTPQSSRIGGPYEHGMESTAEHDAAFSVGRQALFGMWAQLRPLLHEEGVPLSLIHMAATVHRASLPAPFPPSPKARTPPRRRRSGYLYDHFLAIRILHQVIYATRLGMNDLIRSSAQTLLQSAYGITLPEDRIKETHIPGRQSQRIFNSGGVPSGVQGYREEWDATSALLDDDVDPCPWLLLDNVRSALVRSYPRTDYSVGLGPYLESVWSYLPGHDLVGRWTAQALML